MEEVGETISAFELIYAVDYPIKRPSSFASITVNPEHRPFDTNHC